MQPEVTLAPHEAFATSATGSTDHPLQPKPGPQRFNVPWQTVLILTAALAIGASPEVTELLTCTRNNWVQLWPALTGHLCHWTGGHLFWDVMAFAIAGPFVERRLGRSFLPCVGLVSVAIVGVVFSLMPEIESYRGLSGIDTFLYTFAVLDLMQAAYPKIACRFRGLLVLPLLLLLAKLLFELLTGGSLFAGPLGQGVLPLPIAHLMGALVGLLAWKLSAIRPSV